MKTKNLKQQPESLEDIIFENRNKAYGAYALNKKHRKYLMIAFVLSLAGFSTAVAVPFFRAMNNKGIQVSLDKTVKYKMSDVDPAIEPPPPSVPPPIDESTIKQAIYVAPEVVENALSEESLITVESLIETFTNEHVPENIKVVEPIKEIDEPESEPVFFPEEQAVFMNGTLNDFRNWVQSNLVYPRTAIEYEIQGKVYVQFCVNSRGEVVDVLVVRSIDPLLDTESIKVISSSPRWRAAKQGGRPVKQQFVIPVTFLIQ